jgi:hypothetical protein
VTTQKNDDLQQIENALVEFSAVDAGIALLRETYAGVVYDVTTTGGMTAAKAARNAVREPRVAVEKIRKEAKAPILALGRRLDSEAARITAELLKLEEPIAAQIKAEEDRKERERQAMIEAEQKRVARIQERIANIRGTPRVIRATTDAKTIGQCLADVTAIVVDASFEEFVDAAKAAQNEVIRELGELYQAARDREAREKALRIEQERLARERAEHEAREREARAQREAEERAAREAREAEERRLAAEREALAAERRKLEEERAAAEAQKQREAEERARAEEAARKAAEPPPAVAEPKPPLPRDDYASPGWVVSADLVSHLKRQREFSLRTFGPGTRSEAVVAHIRKELDEVLSAPGDLGEWIDIVLLALDGAWRAGWEPEEIAAGLLAKQYRNEARRWPDWRTQPAGTPIEHVRTDEAAA